MTLISTKDILAEMEFPAEAVTPLDKGEGSIDLELRSFPPVTDTIDFIKQVDWEDVRHRSRAGLNNVGLVIAILGEKIHDLGAFLAQV